MKVAILAGGLGSRLAEETDVRPKPMVEIGGRPILWHIMKTYRHFGFRDFVVAVGYKGEMIKRYFLDYQLMSSDLQVSLASGEYRFDGTPQEDWSVELIETGLATMTGGRIKRLIPHVGGQTFMLTYGDGVANVDIPRLLALHREKGKLATVTAVRPPARFGELTLDGDSVVRFEEKPQTGEGWINGGFFVLEPGVADYISGDESVWEREPMQRLARDGQLNAYLHPGFWQPMDTLREKRLLEQLWQSSRAPWKVW